MDTRGSSKRKQEGCQGGDEVGGVVDKPTVEFIDVSRNRTVTQVQHVGHGSVAPVARVVCVCAVVGYLSDVETL